MPALLIGRCRKRRASMVVYDILCKWDAIQQGEPIIGSVIVGWSAAFSTDDNASGTVGARV